MARRRLFMDICGLALFLAICLGIGALGSWVTAGSVGSWYPTLNKPSFNPPNWIFAPVWTTLYVLMAIAGWRVWRTDDGLPVRIPLMLFGLQLGLNLAWSVVFFGFHDLAGAAVVIVALDFAVASTLHLFARRDRLAGALLVPYLLWILFATVLTGAIWRLN